MRECDMWDAGALIAQSWHRKEEIRQMANAAEMIEAGESLGAWPISVITMDMRTPDGLFVPGRAVVATYRPGSRRNIRAPKGMEYLQADRVSHGAMGGRYTPLSPAEWRATIEAAVKAGAKPAGAFSLANGGKMLATFSVPGDNSRMGPNGAIQSYLNLLESMDGSTGYCVGGTDIRTVCRNTMRGWLAQGAHGSIRHTKSIEALAVKIREAMEIHLREGQKMRELYLHAKETKLVQADAQKLFDELFPDASDEMKKDPAKKAAVTKLTNTRNEALAAMKRPENFEGKGSLATLWNGATWAVTHKADGSMQEGKGGAELIDSLLLGSRAKRIQQIEAAIVQRIPVVMRDGSIQQMTAQQAASHGIDNGQIGRALIDDMLN